MTIPGHVAQILGLECRGWCLEEFPCHMQEETSACKGALGDSWMYASKCLGLSIIHREPCRGITASVHHISFLRSFPRAIAAIRVKKVSTRMVPASDWELGIAGGGAGWQFRWQLAFRTYTTSSSVGIRPRHMVFMCPFRSRAHTGGATWANCQPPWGR